MNIAEKVAARNTYSPVHISSIAMRIATAYTLALSIGKALQDVIFSGPGALFPSNYFVVKDTHAQGVKGFSSGYFSFGLEPFVWTHPSNDRMRVLASGSTMLVWGEYKATGIQSTKPPESTMEWSGNPLLDGVVINVEVYVGYYNKLKGGNIQLAVHVGTALVEFDEFENANVRINNPQIFKNNIENFIVNTQLNPPPTAISVPKTTPKTTPIKPTPSYGPASDLPEYASIEEFKNFVEEFGPSDPFRSEYDAGGKAVGPGWVYGPADLNLLSLNTGLPAKEIRKQLDEFGLVFDPEFRLRISSKQSSWCISKLMEGML